MIPVVVLSLLLFVFPPSCLPLPPCHFPILPIVSPSYPLSSFSSCPSSSSSCPSSSSLSCPPSFTSSSPLPLPPPVVGFPTSPLIVIIGIPTQQSHWGARVLHHLCSCCHIAPPPISPLLVISLLFLLVIYTPHHWFMPFIIGLCPSSLGYALCHWVMTFIVELCLSSLWPRCGHCLAGPYSSLSGHHLLSGHRWSSDHHLSLGRCLPW